MEQLKQLQAKLDEKIPASAVQERQGSGGAKLSYLSGHYVINRLNDVFGSLGWASDIKSIDKLFEGKVQSYRGETNYVSYRAVVRLVVSINGVVTEHTDIGFGDGQDANNPGKCHELALKEAVTDGLKRCAKNLGMSMGLALYDKDRPNVEEAVPQKPAEQPLTKTAAPVKLDLAKILKGISDTSKVLVAKQFSSVEELKKLMKDKFNVDAKEALNETQASELLTNLKTLLKEKSDEQNKQQQ